jgi:predicted MPP superfamily phosphohydrolase
MFNFDLSEGNFPIIVKPNLGQPTIINIKEFVDNTGSNIKNILFEAYVIALPTQNIEQILEFFDSNLFVTPILKDTGKFSERRGELYPLQILEINKFERLDFREQAILNEEVCTIWDIFNNFSQIDNLFGKRTELYKLSIQIKEIKDVFKVLKESDRTFLLFDIVHKLPNRMDNKVNYHAIALFDKDWSNFKFIHATDLHIARRNDFISKILKDDILDKIDRYKNRPEKLKKIDTFILSRDFEYKKDFQENKIEKLRYAEYNFNYNLRLLIQFINEQVSKKELDFVLMTGDLVDYIKIARGNNQYKNNFEVFIDILLGKNKGLDKAPYFQDNEYINTREILAPIFTIIGNHDYRKSHYSIRIGSLHKIFGLAKKRTKRYKDLEFFNYFTALKSKDKYLKDYFRYLNPNLNYRIKIGKAFNFIFLETGQDSVADLHDLIKGSPSTKGLKDYQIDLLRKYIKLSQEEKIIIVMHTPPISPNFGALTRRRLKKKLKLKRKVQWSDLYERSLEKYLGNARLDRVLNLKYQTIMYNWDEFLKICTGSDKMIRRKVDLILCGHTHTIKEFGLKEAREKEMISMGFYFTKFPIMVPCEVYTSRYRDVFKTFKNPMDLKIWFDVNKPFIFQTQAVGPLSLKFKFKSPGFRYIMVKNSQISRLRIYSLHLKEKNKQNT